MFSLINVVSATIGSNKHNVICAAAAAAAGRVLLGFTVMQHKCFH